MKTLSVISVLVLVVVLNGCVAYGPVEGIGSSTIETVTQDEDGNQVVVRQIRTPVVIMPVHTHTTYRSQSSITINRGLTGGEFVPVIPCRPHLIRCHACGMSYRSGTRHSCRHRHYNRGNRNPFPDYEIRVIDRGTSHRRTVYCP